MGGKSAKRKGNRVELEVVKGLNGLATNVAVVKQPLSGQLPGRKGDLVVCIADPECPKCQGVIKTATERGQLYIIDKCPCVIDMPAKSRHVRTDRDSARWRSGSGQTTCCFSSATGQSRW